MQTERKKTKTVSERFWEKVDVKGGDDCWLWIARTAYGGYGQFWFRKKTCRTHRVAYTLTKGEIPKGMCVLHIECDNPPCVNSDHLELGTIADNNADKAKKGRHHNSKKTHCPQGHTLSGDNLYINPKGGRQCRKCRRSKRREFTQKNRARLNRDARKRYQRKKAKNGTQKNQN